MASKPPSKKFSTPFKTPPASQTCSIPDDGLDECLLWYPENYTPSQTTPKAKKPEITQKPQVNLKRKAIKQKPKTKAVVKENAMPEMPRTPKTPTKLARIIPKTPTRSGRKNNPKGMKTPERKKGATFKLYGIYQSPYKGSYQSEFSSQISTPGLTQNTLLKKLNDGKSNQKKDRHLMKDRSEERVEQPIHVDEMNEMCQVIVPVIAKKTYAEAKDYVKAHANASTVKAHHNTIEQAQKYLKSQQQKMQPKGNEFRNDSNVYTFNLSPNTQRNLAKKKTKALREKKLKEELLQLISRTAEELRELRERRRILHVKMGKKIATGVLAASELSERSQRFLPSPLLH